MAQLHVQLTVRQREILIRVVDEYVGTGQPVGSKSLVASAGLDVSSSTVRNVFAELEQLGLLTHPHTSAGRIPTEGGYRIYADDALERQRLEPRPAPLALDLTGLRNEVETALAAINTAHNQVSSDISLAQASADQRIVQSRRAVEIETLRAQAEVEPIRALAAELLETFKTGPGVLRTYVRNVRLVLIDKAQNIYLEAGK